MRHFRSLLPYVAAAAVIAVGSIALVYATVDADDVVATSAGAGSPQPLSSSGRLAYWRQSPAGAFVLWASNLDGSQARPLTSLPANTSRPFGTRWTGDGSAIAFVTDQSVGVIVINLDGTRIDMPLPAQLRVSGYRVIDQRWSPSGRRVAATLQRSTDGKTDVYLGSLERREFVRAGDLGNAFAGPWISDDEVLVESDSGVLGALREAGQPIRKLVDRSAASPFFDGSRVHFLSGLVTATGNATGIFVTNPSVWSVLPDGKDLRTGGRVEVAGTLRLDGIWPDDRYLMHSGVDQTQYIVGPRSTSLAPSSLLRRAVVSADKRIAIGFGGSRIVRIDLTRGLNPPEDAFVVLLDGIISADAWVRRSALP